jgi:hypothetical protein
MPEPHPIPSREPAAMRKTLEAMGPDKVRSLMAAGMLVWHLVVPATEWLAGIDAKEKRGAA